MKEKAGTVKVESVARGAVPVVGCFTSPCQLAPDYDG